MAMQTAIGSPEPQPVFEQVMETIGSEWIPLAYEPTYAELVEPPGAANEIPDLDEALDMRLVSL